MALSRTFHNSTRGGDNVQTITTASFTPTANSLLIIAANHTVKVGGDNTANISIANTGGLTFTKLTSHTWTPISYGGNLNIWYCEVGSSPSAMTVTVSHTLPVNSYGSSIDAFDYTGYDTSDPFGFTENFTRGTGYPNSTTGDGAWSVTLATAPASTSEVVAVIIVDGVGATTVSVGSGWTEIADPGSGSTEAQQIQVRSGSTSTSLDWADACDNAAGAYVNLAIAFEIKEASGGGGGSAIVAIINSYRRRREQP